MLWISQNGFHQLTNTMTHLHCCCLLCGMAHTSLSCSWTMNGILTTKMQRTFLIPVSFMWQWWKIVCANCSGPLVRVSDKQLTSGCMSPWTRMRSHHILEENIVLFQRHNLHKGKLQNQLLYLRTLHNLQLTCLSLKMPTMIWTKPKTRKWSLVSWKSWIHWFAGLCLKKFSTKSNLMKHTKLHSGKLYKCSTEGCAYSGRSPYNLMQHELTCKDLIHFQCPASRCKKDFKHCMQLWRHIHDCHHTKQGKKWHFWSRSTLQKQFWHSERLHICCSTKKVSCLWILFHLYVANIYSCVSLILVHHGILEVIWCGTAFRFFLPNKFNPSLGSGRSWPLFLLWRKFVP